MEVLKILLFLLKNGPSGNFVLYKETAAVYCLILESWFKSVGTLRSEDGDGNENVDEKVNFLSFNLHCNYTMSLTLSNVGEPF